jgi:succinate dehydrogenase / fumarate reductase membrane anchor subunit
MGIINNGVKQWVFQRVSNTLIVSFGISLLCVFFAANGLSYESLKALFASQGFKIYFAVLLVFSCVNSVLAGWQIDGDYAKKFGLPYLLITVTTLLVSGVYLFYGLGMLF